MENGFARDSPRFTLSRSRTRSCSPRTGCFCIFLTIHLQHVAPKAARIGFMISPGIRLNLNQRTKPVGPLLIAVVIVMPAGGTLDSVIVTFSLVAAGTTVPAVPVSLAQNGFIVDSSGLGSISLSTFAQEGGAVVTLSSSNPAAVSMPATVTVGQGYRLSSPFLVASSAVDAMPVTLSASFNGATQSVPFTAAPTSPLAVLGLTAEFLPANTTVPPNTIRLLINMSRTNKSQEPSCSPAATRRSHPSRKLHHTCAECARRLPVCKLYHDLQSGRTGYAGDLQCFVQRRRREHYRHDSEDGGYCFNQPGGTDGQEPAAQGRCDQQHSGAGPQVVQCRDGSVARSDDW